MFNQIALYGRCFDIILLFSSLLWSSNISKLQTLAQTALSRREKEAMFWVIYESFPTHGLFKDWWLISSCESKATPLGLNKARMMVVNSPLFLGGGGIGGLPVNSHDFKGSRIFIWLVPLNFNEFEEICGGAKVLTCPYRWYINISYPQVLSTTVHT